MKKILIILAFISAFYNPLYSQTKKDSDYQEDIYNQALFAGLKEMSRVWGYLTNLPDTTRIHINYNNMIVKRDAGITEHIQSRMDSIYIKLLDDAELINKCKVIKKEFPIIRIWPIKNQGPCLVVSITLDWVNYDNNILNVMLSDFCEITFSFDCVKQKYIIVNTQLGGI
jgi:hypothetical protein